MAVHERRRPSAGLRAEASACASCVRMLFRGGRAIGAHVGQYAGCRRKVDTLSSRAPSKAAAVAVM